MVAARQLESRVVSGDIYVTFFFFTKQFLFLKILKPFFKKQLILLLKCSWFVFFFFTLCRPVKCRDLFSTVDCGFQDSRELIGSTLSNCVELNSERLSREV